MISTPGPLELIFLLGLALLVLGPNRLPDAARAAGKAVRELRDALSTEKDDEDEFASGDQEELAEAGPAAEASYREAVDGDDDAGNGNGGEAVDGDGDDAGTDEPATRRRGTDTEAGEPAPPPVS